MGGFRVGSVRLPLFFCSSFRRRLESSAFACFLARHSSESWNPAPSLLLMFEKQKLPLLRAGNFFAGAKKSPRNTFLRVEVCVRAGRHPCRRRERRTSCAPLRVKVQRCF